MVRRARGRWLPHLAIVLLSVLGLLLLATGCRSTMSEDDCRKVGDALQAAWEADAKQAAQSGRQINTNAAVVLDSEGKKLSSEWALDCRRELLGRRVDPKELACLTRSKTLEELGRCAAP